MNNNTLFTHGAARMLTVRNHIYRVKLVLEFFP